MMGVIIFLLVLVPFEISAEQDIDNMSVDDIKIIRISAQDEKAIIKCTDGKLQVLGVGDKIGTNAKVTEITRGRIVIEELTGRGRETVIIRVESGKQRVERMSKVVKDRPQLYAPPTKGSTKGSTKDTKEHEERK